MTNLTAVVTGYEDGAWRIIFNGFEVTGRVGEDMEPDADRSGMAINYATTMLPTVIKEVLHND